jgi:hypothetical protein
MPSDKVQQNDTTQLREGFVLGGANSLQCCAKGASLQHSIVNAVSTWQPFNNMAAANGYKIVMPPCRGKDGRMRAQIAT